MILIAESTKHIIKLAIHLGNPGSISAEDIFLASLHALVRGEAKAIGKVRRDARREWQEIEQVGRREALSSLPATFEEFSKELDDSGADIEAAAEALGSC